MLWRRFLLQPLMEPLNPTAGIIANQLAHIGPHFASCIECSDDRIGLDGLKVAPGSLQNASTGNLLGNGCLSNLINSGLKPFKSSGCADKSISRSKRSGLRQYEKRGHSKLKQAICLPQAITQSTKLTCPRDVETSQYQILYIVYDYMCL